MKQFLFTACCMSLTLTVTCGSFVSAPLAADARQCLELINAKPRSNDPTAFEACRFAPAARAAVTDAEALAIGTFLADNFVARKGLPESRQWVQSLAEQGNPDALYLVARSIPSEDPRSTAAYALAAKMGSLDAQYMVALIYEDVRHVPRDTELAEALLRDLATKQHAGAIDKLFRLEGHQSLEQYRQDAREAAERDEQAKQLLGVIVLGFAALAVASATNPSSPAPLPSDDGYRRNECDTLAQGYALGGGDHLLGSFLALNC